MTANDIKKAILLDRDGTISPDEYGYNGNPDLYDLYEESIPALKIFQDLGYYLFIVTNQSGIARKYFSLEELESVHTKMRRLLKDGGIELDGVYFAPYHKDGILPPYNVRHEDRKPGIGMYKQAMRDMPFDPRKSFMIGDRYTDIAFAKNAGLKSILVLTGDGRDEFARMLRGERKLVPNFVCENLLIAAKMIKRFYP